MSLKIAAKVDRADQAYWEEMIRPMVKAHPNVEFVGEIGEGDKAAFLGGASALLFPVDWPEPFGLVMIESMACGTPVIAFRRGAVPEIVNHGTSGFIVETIEAAVRAVHSITDLDRVKVRAEFERCFTADRMARDYLKIYCGLISPGRSEPADRVDGSDAIVRAPRRVAAGFYD
jgi:glycosyltransferase involved in cell wall biosynthesis